LFPIFEMVLIIIGYCKTMISQMVQTYDIKIGCYFFILLVSSFWKRESSKSPAKKLGG